MSENQKSNYDDNHPHWKTSQNKEFKTFTLFVFQQTIDCKTDTTWKEFGDTNMTRTDKAGSQQRTNLRLVQSLNSPFFPPPIGAEPGRAKGESRITCMRMLRTNQSKITRVLTTLLASMCRAMPFSARALKKKPRIFFGVDIVVKNIKT